MLERLMKQVEELHRQLLVEMAAGRDVYWGPELQGTLRAISKSYLAGDWYLAVDAARQAQVRVVDDREAPRGFVTCQPLAGGEFVFAASAVAAVREMIDNRTCKGIGSMVYVSGISQGVQVGETVPTILAAIAAAQRPQRSQERCELFAVEGMPGALLNANMGSRGKIGAAIPPGVWRVVLERVPRKEERSVGE